MAAPNTIVIFSLILLSIFRAGQADEKYCTESDIVVEQKNTRNIVEGIPEYEVLVRNDCNCTQHKVYVQCSGLSSIEQLDTRAILPVNGSHCILNGGRPIVRGSPLKFKYASLNPLDFPVVGNEYKC